MLIEFHDCNIVRLSNFKLRQNCFSFYRQCQLTRLLHPVTVYLYVLDLQMVEPTQSTSELPATCFQMFFDIDIKSSAEISFLSDHFFSLKCSTICNQEESNFINDY